MSLSRAQYLADVKSVVVKLGTQLLSDREGKLDTEYLREVGQQVAELYRRGVWVTIVSSGAIGAGMAELKLTSRPRDLSKLQAVAAVGQRRLMDAWAAAFAHDNLPVAQILLTRDDVDRRARFLNLRNTIQSLHELGAIPIINENDTVSTDELVRISFGDNDLLAALVTQSLRADLLVLLTVVDGLLDEKGKRVDVVHSVEEAQQLVRTEKSALGKGGMNSKLEAARIVTSSGEAMIVADGRGDRVLASILAGEAVGTLFVPRARRRSSRSRWIGSARTVGTIVVDAGAARALKEKNGSLLAAGIARVEGTFEKGDLVEIVSADAQVIGRGLTNYAAEVIEKIRGKKSAEVRSLLGEAAYDEVVHRDNLVLA